MEQRQADLRRHPRTRVTWPVTVEAGQRLVQLETIDLSPFGAKLRAADPALEPGTQVQLRFTTPAGEPLDVMAIVWRSDPDGPAFFFITLDTQDFAVPTEGLASTV